MMMIWPTVQFPGKILLLSEPQNFNAAYIRRSLEFWGIPVLTMEDAPNKNLADIRADDLARIVGCVAVDFDKEAFAALVSQQWPFPLLFVGAFPAPLAGGYAWMQTPFASFEVIERMMALMSSNQDADGSMG